MTTVIVVAGGVAPDPSLRELLPPADAVIAADSGYDHALRLGLSPAVLVGDLDSISADGLAAAERAGVRIERHPPDKDATDLELALELAARGADEIVVVAGDVGRFDHAVGNLLLLGAERYAGVRISARLALGLVTVVRSERTLTGQPGDIVSLFAVGGPASGVTTTGLRWPLHEATLAVGSTLGTSNEMLGTEATVEVADGVVFAIQPIGG